MSMPGWMGHGQLSMATLGGRFVPGTPIHKLGDPKMWVTRLLKERTLGSSTFADL